MKHYTTICFNFLFLYFALFILSIYLQSCPVLAPPLGDKGAPLDFIPFFYCYKHYVSCSWTIISANLLKGEVK